MKIKINGESLHDELYFCQKHKVWNQADDESNCCAIELEEQLLLEEGDENT